MSPQMACDGKCVTAPWRVKPCFLGMSSNEGPVNGRFVVGRQWNAMHETSRCIAIAALANWTLEMDVENADFGGALTGETATATSDYLTRRKHLVIAEIINP